MKHIEQDNVQDNVQTCSSMFKAPGPTSASYSSLRSRLQMLKADPGEAAAMIQVIHGHRWHDGYLLLRGSHSGCLLELLALKNLRHGKGLKRIEKASYCAGASLWVDCD